MFSPLVWLERQEFACAISPGQVAGHLACHKADLFNRPGRFSVLPKKGFEVMEDRQVGRIKETLV